MKSEKGFTLIELMLYIVIAVIVSFAVMLFAWNVIDNKAKITAYQEVQQNARMALNIMIQNIKQAERIPSGEKLPFGNLASQWLHTMNSLGNLEAAYARQPLKITGSTGANKNYPIKIKLIAGPPAIWETYCYNTINTICFYSTECLKPNDTVFAYDNAYKIRITAADGITLLDYWVEDAYVQGSETCPDANDNKMVAFLWVKIPDDLNYNRLIYLYYPIVNQNSPIEQEKNQRALNIFTFFDDFLNNASQTNFFSTPPYDDNWQAPKSSQQNPSASDSRLVLSKLSGLWVWNQLKKIETLSRPIAIRLKAKMTDSTDDGDNLSLLLFSDTILPSATYPNYYYKNNLFKKNISGTGKLDIEKKEGSSSLIQNWSKNWSWEDNKDYYFDIMATSSISISVQDLSLLNPDLAVVNTSNELAPYELGRTSINVTGSGNTAQIDWFFVRPYVWPEPYGVNSIENIGDVNGEEWIEFSSRTEQDLSKLSLQLFGSGDNIVRFRVLNGILQMDYNDDDWQSLISDNMEATNLTFYDLSWPAPIEENPSSKTIRIELTIKQRNPNNFAPLRAETHLEQTVNFNSI